MPLEMELKGITNDRNNSMRMLQILHRCNTQQETDLTTKVYTTLQNYQASSMYCTCIHWHTFQMLKTICLLLCFLVLFVTTRQDSKQVFPDSPNHDLMALCTFTLNQAPPHISTCPLFHDSFCCDKPVSPLGSTGVSGYRLSRVIRQGSFGSRTHIL